MSAHAEQKILYKKQSIYHCPHPAIHVSRMNICGQHHCSQNISCHPILHKQSINFGRHVHCPWRLIQIHKYPSLKIGNETSCSKPARKLSLVPSPRVCLGWREFFFFWGGGCRAQCTLRLQTIMSRPQTGHPGPHVSSLTGDLFVSHEEKQRWPLTNSLLVQFLSTTDQL